MDKYEYNVKSDQIRKLYSHKEYEAAAKIADEIDWRKVKDNSMISRVADVYENNKEYSKAKEILLIAYERSPLGRQLAYRLTILSLRTRDFVEADEFYQDFVEMSPMDVAQYILKYRIAKAKGEDTDILISILEAYVEVEKDERWQYELAKLYHDAGYEDKCVSMCEDIIVWFNGGKYVEKAIKLKQLHKKSAVQPDIPAKKEIESTPVISELSEETKQPVSDNTLQNIVLKGSLREKERSVEGITGILKGLDNLMEETGEPEEVKWQEESAIQPETAAQDLSVQEKIDAALADDTDAAAVNAALEAIKAAEKAAYEAQKAAEVAKRLAREAQLKAQAAEKAARHEDISDLDIDDDEEDEDDIYAGLSGEEISRQMEEEDILKGDAEIAPKDVIEIFEFDEKKDGKCSHIGEELTKTAEIDIEEINFQIEKTENNIYDTANIQAALAVSMEKIMDMESSKPEEARNPFEPNTEESAELQPELEMTDSVQTKETEQEQADAETDIPERTFIEEVTESDISEKTELSKSTESESVSGDINLERTKVIDREAISRAMARQKEFFSKISMEEDIDLDEPMEINEQIEGQVTIEEVLTEYERRKEETMNTAKMAEAIEAVKAEMAAEEQEALNLKQTEPVVHIEVKQETDTDIVQKEEEAPAQEKTAEPAVPKEAPETVVPKEAPETVVPKEAPETAVPGKVNDINLQALSVHKIPEIFKNMFGDFLTFEGMEEKIADTLNNLINNFVMDGTSKTNNVIITGSAKVGKTALGLSIIKAANRGRKRKRRKVAKVKATALNKRGVSTAMMQILGTDLIIEQAGNLMPNTLIDLMTVMKSYTEEMLIILEDDKAAIDRMLDNMPDLKELFNNRVDIMEFEINDLVKVAKAYAEREHYTIDDIGILALYAKIDDISGRNQGMTFEEVEEVIDDAIDHANRFTIGKIIGKLKKNKLGMGVLTEEDFL
ncbi:MAG: hypothetical protein HFI34_09015 [Lachnospiraceae bacterium]|nr:hypothetical protein [Lachnospiraceae bacterium]